MVTYFREVIPTVNHIEGDYVELGFGGGVTTEIFCRGVQKGLFKKRDMWLFDSFEGLPEPSENDISKRNPKKGQLSFKGFEGFKEIESNFPDMNMNPVKGYFNETVPDGYSGEKIAILHLDCDLYESYKKGFDLIDKVVPGGIIMFDEFEDHRWPGATKAILERFNREDLKSFDPDGKFPKWYTIV